eukprot:gene7953-18748_t
MIGILIAGWIMHKTGLSFAELAAAAVVAVLAINCVLSYIKLDSKGKAVVITGCDTGFGRTLALKMDALGYKVFAGCITESGRGSLVKEGNTIEGIMVDVTKQDQIDAALVHIKKALVDTNAVLWGLVNNAGILPLGFVEACPMENYRKCMEINTFGAVATCKTFLPLIRESEGRIVNVCSVAGRIGVGTWSAYSMSKFALEAFTDCLRREMELWNVKVITIEPGYFKTDLTKPERFRQLMKDNWDKSPACVRDDYGEELFERIAAASSKATTLLGSSQLELVPDAIVQALTARWPSKRVAVGLDAKLAWIPLSFFPDQPLDKIFAATQWLFAGTLVPALKAKKAKSKAE